MVKKNYSIICTMISNAQYNTFSLFISVANLTKCIKIATKLFYDCFKKVNYDRYLSNLLTCNTLNLLLLFISRCSCIISQLFLD